ncbi:MAG TPA: metalloregulator ArsR/SmtB family transcription factor [Candidatus Aerophobetes bacterium]|uniref:Metalloregulator ArsR/SmtB family transcription factor n=1 Tax=Aerophobetes bacterium TaxID=2030807 RepID=A0A7V5M0C5_UNCAE|nr:metalloregulator ArsR/SmtB family transcription factor [Candidatus Aerophobetes bacterium]
MQEILNILKILSDEIRLKIVYLLSQESELCVCELMEALKMSQSRISNHLRILRNTGIIEAKREGKWMFYCLKRDKMDKAILNIIVNITKTIDKEGYLTEEKELVKKLISKRGELSGSRKNLSTG